MTAHNRKQTSLTQAEVSELLARVIILEKLEKYQNELIELQKERITKLNDIENMHTKVVALDDKMIEALEKDKQALLAVIARITHSDGEVIYNYFMEGVDLAPYLAPYAPEIVALQEKIR